ncbi:Gfo/Idh/MocA family protein [Schumannella soli]|uniref:Gfo/Idh/MocA family oxidoreductase n=1 Tax=Schumannella soli TaxID=2590779 RepID=A0A506Y0F1_9MICO|nr:Gfo/Idh/MocA family oxidoreductase [Schumannella soli]TPW75986.1 Gfo/Idh/MocA family oxidoreductase [Schumannella soli]
MTRRIALVGAGSMGRNHARVIAENPDATLELVVDPFEETGRPTADRYGARWVPSIEEKGDLDGVVIAATTEHHFRIASDIIALDLPLLVEKPICPSLEQTEQILAASRTAGVPIMCGFLERYNPAVIVARKLVDTPLFIRAERHSPYAPRIKTGVAWDLLVHDVDLIAQFYRGKTPASINVESGLYHPLSVPGAEDVIETTLRFDDGGIASASASRIGQRKVRSMVIQSLENMVEIDLLRRGVTVYRHTTLSDDGADGAGFRQSTEMEVPEIFGKEPLAAQFDRFLQLIAGEVDADAERESILPAHRIVDQALAGRAE